MTGGNIPNLFKKRLLRFQKFHHLRKYFPKYLENLFQSTWKGVFTYCVIHRAFTEEGGVSKMLTHDFGGRGGG